MRAAVVLFHYDAAGSPSILNAIGCLIDAGYAVDLFVDTPPAAQCLSPSQAEHFDLICVTDSRSAKKESRSKLSPQSRIKRVPGWSFVRDLYVLFGWKLPYLFRYGTKCCWQMHKRGRYELVIGAETMGLVPAGVYAGLSRTRLVYWCLELITWRDAVTLLSKFMKLCENYFAKRAVAVVIQDQERAEVFCRDSDVPADKIVLVPASARGPAIYRRTRYFHAKYALPENTKIALHAGSIEPWSQCLEVIEGSRSLPPDWKLVIHGFGPSDYINEVVKAASNQENVIISLDFVPYTQLDALVAGADVGLAMYRPTSVNWQLMGAASSKIAQYLKVGVPVIHNSSGRLKEITDRMRCGIYIADPAQFSAAISQLARLDLDPINNALRSFDEIFDYDLYFRDFLRRISAFASNSATKGASRVP